MKYIITCGTTLSGLGKGTLVSTLGVLLKMYGYKVTLIKIDPYFNVDAGTLSPYEHGEVYVMDDGGETDLDLGNYERMNHLTLSSQHNMTSGSVFQKTINEERRGDYLGKTVQMIPHCSNQIKKWIRSVAKQTVFDEISGEDYVPEICLIEIGGTVGDIESMIYYEAVRQMKMEDSEDDFVINMLTYVPEVGGEPKTKPTQSGFKSLMMHGILPDYIFCRSPKPLSIEIKTKISSFCNSRPEKVYDMYDVEHTYYVYGVLHKSGIVKDIVKTLNLPESKGYCSSMEDMIGKLATCTEELKIAIVGKYCANKDAYQSLAKAIEHATFHSQRKPNIVFIDSEKILKIEDMQELSNSGIKGFVIAGGFGARGYEGKVIAIQYCREQKIPVLGICLGFQLMVIEGCRNLLGNAKAEHAEFAVDDSNVENHVIVDMPEFKTDNMGGSMRLGKRMTILEQGSYIEEIYNKHYVFERHRHRYEVNPKWIADFLKLKHYHFTGKGDENRRMEVLEMDRTEHPYFVGVQYHPEYLSRPLVPHPLFTHLIRKSIDQNEV